jgi:Lrp/AsnC family leucine-responsive transcriptional regulator
VGQGLGVTILVTMETERRDLIEDFKRRMRRRAEVMMCFYVTGAVDFVVLATFADMAGFEAFAAEELHEDRNVKRFETLVTMNRVKVGLAVPIP